MQKTRSTFSSSFTQSLCSTALKLSAKKLFLDEGKQLHTSMIKLGYNAVLSLQNQLLNVYIKCKQVDDARNLFDEILVRNVVTWNILISGLVDCGRSFADLGICYFRRMVLDIFAPDRITYMGLLRLCVERNDIENGRQLHCSILKSGFSEDCFVRGRLVDLYAKFGLVKTARKVFDSVLDRDIVLWNVMVSCYAFNGLEKEAFQFFNLMRLKGVKADDFTFTSLINSCAISGSCESGKQIHGLIFKQGFDLDVVMASALIAMYTKNKKIDDGLRVFDRMVSRNLISWTTLIVGYGQHGHGKEATKVLVAMMREGFNPDELTLSSVISSCGNLSLFGEIVQVQAYAFKKGFSVFLSIGNALISAYCKCGSIVCAFQSFNSIVDPDHVSWTSIVGACAFHGLSRQAIQLFEKMLSNGIRPDRIAFLGILSACCHGGLVNEGLHYFSLMTDVHQIVPDSEHYTCLIDLLGRSGLLTEAFKILSSMPIEPGADTLGAFIGACKVHGNVELAKWAAEKILVLEPNKPVNYALMSNIYASLGCWNDVSRIRKKMRENCYYKVPGCSWMEIASEFHTFVSSDKSHPKTLEMNDTLGLLFREMKDDYCMSDVDFMHRG